MIKWKGNSKKGKERTTVNKMKENGKQNLKRKKKA